MAGICSRHQHFQPDCPICESGPRQKSICFQDVEDPNHLISFESDKDGLTIYFNGGFKQLSEDQARELAYQLGETFL